MPLLIITAHEKGSLLSFNAVADPARSANFETHTAVSNCPK